MTPLNLFTPAAAHWLPTVCEIFERFKSAMIGGSFVIDPVTANDIDVCINQYDCDDDYIRNVLGFRALQEGDRKYPKIDRLRLIEVYEKDERKKINLIVVGAIFWPAYVGAIQEMKSHPDLYQTREARIALHKRCCRDAGQVAGRNYDLYGV